MLSNLRVCKLRNRSWNINIPKGKKTTQLWQGSTTLDLFKIQTQNPQGIVVMQTHVTHHNKAAQRPLTYWRGRPANEASQCWTAGQRPWSASAAAAPSRRRSEESLQGLGCQEYWEGPSWAGPWRTPALRVRRCCGGIHGSLKESSSLWLTAVEQNTCSGNLKQDISYV